jgi:hypothetical protein
VSALWVRRAARRTAGSSRNMLIESVSPAAALSRLAAVHGKLMPMISIAVEQENRWHPARTANRQPLTANQFQRNNVLKAGQEKGGSPPVRTANRQPPTANLSRRNKP